ncbi:MAG: EamA family transporter [Chloroflexi bacterium]|nr:EamA family transporter [Chloroflexota bacterium]
MKAKDYALALLVITVWGLNFVVIKLTMQSMPPMLIVTLRYALIALPLLPFVKRPPIKLRWLALYAIMLGTVHQGLLFLGIKAGMGAGLSSLVLQTQVFFTLGFAAIFLKEKIRPQQIAGMALAGVGLYLIATATDHSSNLLAFTLMIGSAVTWAIATMFSKHASNTATGPIEPLSFMVWAAVFPPLPTFALSLLIDGPAAIVAGVQALTLPTVAGLAFITYGSTLLGFVIWNMLIARHGASHVTQFSLLVPVVGMSSAALVLGENVPPLKAFAAGLILVGLMISMFGSHAVAFVTRRFVGTEA